MLQMLSGHKKLGNIEVRGRETGGEVKSLISFVFATIYGQDCLKIRKKWNNHSIKKLHFSFCSCCLALLNMCQNTKVWNRMITVKMEAFYQRFLDAKIFVMLNTIKTNSKTDHSSYSCRIEICVHFYS